MQLIKRQSNIVLFALILIENIFLFCTHVNGLGQTKNSILYFVTSVLVGFMVIYRFYNKHIVADVPKPKEAKKTSWLLLLCALIPFIFIAANLHTVFNKLPIDPKESDIIPLIQIMVQRFTNGMPVYTPPIYDFGYELIPTYLPMQWLPFSLAELLHFDYRWIPFGVFLLSTIIVLVRCLKLNSSYIKLGVPAMVYFIYYCICEHDRHLIPYTVELLIAGYYMLLIIGLNGNNIFITAITITCCLISRYSLVLWLPLWAFTYLASGRKKEMLKITGIVIVLVAIIYVIPFLSKDWGSFYRGYKYYDAAAIGEWGHLDGKRMPYALYNGVGFAHIFYRMHNNWQLIDKIKQLQKVHLLMSLGICFVMGIWYWFNRKKVDYRIFLMASFKIYFAFFLAFIQVPYVYLMMVASFVSITIFAEQLRYKILPKQ